MSQSGDQPARHWPEPDSTIAALDVLTALYHRDDVIELRALNPHGGTAVSYNGRLGHEREQMADFIRRHNGRWNVYCGINPRPASWADTDRPAKDDDIAARRYVVLDLDDEKAPPQDAGWRRTIAAMQGHDPVMTSMSGNGHHVWFSVEPDPDVQTGALYDAENRIGIDRIANPSRIIRLPYTVNLPTKSKQARGRRPESTYAVHGPAANPKRHRIANLVDLLLGIASNLELPGTQSNRRKAPVGPTSPSAPDPAPSLELLREAVMAIPNSGNDEVGRHEWMTMGQRIKGACRGTAFEADGEELYREWSAQNINFDAADNDDKYRGFHADHAGWSALLREVAARNPNNAARLAFSAVPLTQADNDVIDALSAQARLAAGWVPEMNERYALVEGINGVVKLPGEGEPLTTQTLQQFRTFQDGLRKVPEGSNGRLIGVGSAWLAHGGAARYRRIGLWPEGSEPPEALNLFRGLAVKPNRSGSCVRIRSFIADVIASGDPRIGEYVLNWLAWKVQHPLEKPGTNLVLVGEQGTGKSTLGRLMCELFGSLHSKLITQTVHLLGQFTGHLEGVLFLQVDEALFGRDPRGSGQYKALTTEPEMTVEHKGQTPRQVRNHIAMIVTSNSLSAVPVEPGDRRSTVIEVSSARRQDTAYFDALWNEWQNGGAEAFLALLLDRDLTGFDPRIPLHTDAKAAVAAATADAPARFLEACMESGRLPGTMLQKDNSEPNWNQSRVRVWNRELYAAFVQWAKDNRTPYVPGPQEFWASIRRHLPGIDPRKVRPTGGKPANATWFPPLPKCRRILARVLGGDG